MSQIRICPEEINEIAENIRINVYKKGLEASVKEVADVVTVSVGVSLERATLGQSYENYIKRADEALYEAKKNGRNQVVFSN